MTQKPKRATTSGRADWKKQVRWDMEWAKREMLESGDLMPTFYIHSADEVLPVGSNIGREHKQDFYMLLRCMCMARNATALSFIAEAWMRSVPIAPNETKDEARKRATDIAPADAEDRFETIICMTTYRDNTGRHSLSRAVEIKRDWNGKVTGFGDPMDEGDGDKEIGMLDKILPERPASEEQRQMAQAALPALCAFLGINMQTIDLKGGKA